MSASPDATALAADFQLVRTLLRRDYLTGAAWEPALRDLAAMAKEAVRAREALVAIYDATARSWSAVTSAGVAVRADEIALYGSRSVLEAVRTSGEALVVREGDRLPLESDSLAAHGVGSLLAVPLYWWDVLDPRRGRYLAGCLYADRVAAEPPFGDREVELIRDITAIAQRTLNVLRYLRDVETALEARDRELRRLKDEAAEKHGLGAYQTRDPWVAEHVVEPLRRVSRAAKVGILLLGPTGSGKSYLARAYHHACPRKDGPFGVFDCSQVTSAETLGAELFGYAPRSGFANAPACGTAGAAAQANHGTLFIDEVAALPADLQRRLLGVIQSGTYAPLGGSEQRHADLQVIAATNEDLRELVAGGQFREDLYWRLAEVVVELPPLDARAADIPELAELFLAEARTRSGRSELRGFTPAALHRLLNHEWGRSGNLRGLEHTIRRSVLLAPPGAAVLDAADIKLDAIPVGRRERGRRDDESGASPADPRLERYAPEVGEAIRAIRSHGYATAAARALGIHYDALISRLRRAGLSVRDVVGHEDLPR